MERGPRDYHPERGRFARYTAIGLLAFAGLGIILSGIPTERNTTVVQGPGGRTTELTSFDALLWTHEGTLVRDAAGNVVGYAYDTASACVGGQQFHTTASSAGPSESQGLRRCLP